MIIRLFPAFFESSRKAFAIYLELMPCSRSISTPSKPYSFIRLYILPANRLASFVLVTLTVPFSPPIDMITRCPFFLAALISLINCSLLYPPNFWQSVSSRRKVTLPETEACFANATAIRLYSFGTSLILRHLAPLLKFCQYPVIMWLASPVCLSLLPAVFTGFSCVFFVFGVVSGFFPGLAAVPLGILQTPHSSDCFAGSSPCVHHAAS